jgi:hypothetical protein
MPGEAHKWPSARQPSRFHENRRDNRYRGGRRKIFIRHPSERHEDAHGHGRGILSEKYCHYHARFESFGGYFACQNNLFKSLRNCFRFVKRRSNGWSDRTILQFSYLHKSDTADASGKYAIDIETRYIANAYLYIVPAHTPTAAAITDRSTAPFLRSLFPFRARTRVGLSAVPTYRRFNKRLPHTKDFKRLLPNGDPRIYRKKGF